jgi:putative transcriptional regulator
MELRNRLREHRLERGLTQEALANMVRVTRQTIIAIEKGGYTPSVKLALELAHSLEAPIEDVFWLDEKKGS